MSSGTYSIHYFELGISSQLRLIKRAKDRYRDTKRDIRTLPRHMQYIAYFKALDEWIVDLNSISHEWPLFDRKTPLKSQFMSKLAKNLVSFNGQGKYPWIRLADLRILTPSTLEMVVEWGRYWTVKMVARVSSFWRLVAYQSFKIASRWINWQYNTKIIIINK